MRWYIQGVLVLALLVGSEAAQEEATRLVYFVEHEDEQAEDFIEITLEIESQSNSLVSAIEDAGKVAQEVTALAVSYCKEYTKKGKGDCKQAVEVGRHLSRSASSKFNRSTRWSAKRPLSQVFRPHPAFVVTHEVTVNVFNPENIGYLVDSLLKYSDLTLKDFNWLPLIVDRW
jgi:hypothetical protein